MPINRFYYKINVQTNTYDPSKSCSDPGSDAPPRLSSSTRLLFIAVDVSCGPPKPGAGVMASCQSPVLESWSETEINKIFT